ncbi:FxsA family protein [Thalassotalea psychrophila]|uniref:FxsA family protein n=1 Tax=Thalassotalea psychrophila TaxID=3065647 RepID=A0ABY9TSK4_9GAMM|nr:FxsA family protein [Colwelliaceae bacterium SQ149]
MFKVLFLLFIVMPIVEIMVLMNVGSLIGALPTIGIVILTAWIGAAMVRQQGMATYQSVQNKLAQGQIPSDEIIAAMLLLVAGVLLLTPGFITDGFGLLLLWPVSRAVIVKAVQTQMAKSKANPNNGSTFFYSNFQQSDQQQSPFRDIDENSSTHHINDNKSNQTIDGEFERKD